MTHVATFQRWVLALLVSAILATMCIAYVDRPVAEFSEAHVRHAELWILIDRTLRPLNLVVPGTLFFLFGCGGLAASGYRLGPWIKTPLLCSWSATWAAVADIVFKQIFGRGWPDPTYVHDHLYGFHFLHGAPHWNSFPSGTAAISTAIVSVMWMMNVRWRVPALLIAIFLCILVTIANFHWISDVIAGAALGGTIGWFTLRLDSRSRDPR